MPSQSNINQISLLASFLEMKNDDENDDEFFIRSLLHEAGWLGVQVEIAILIVADRPAE
jgi:hypothetical protein